MSDSDPYRVPSSDLATPSTPSTPSAPRPRGVTIACVLLLLANLASFVEELLISDEMADLVSEPIVIAVMALVLAAVVLLPIWLMYSRYGWARYLMLVLEVLGIIAVVSTPLEESTAITDLFYYPAAVYAYYLLFTKASNAWYRGDSQKTP